MTLRSQMNSKSSNNPCLFDKPEKKIKKRHWLLASAIVVVGSWITHTTTANIKTQTLQEASSSTTLNLPVANQFIFNSSNRLASIITTDPFHHVISKPLFLKNTLENNSIVDSLVNADADLTSVTHTIKKGESLGTIFRKLSLDLSLAYKISKHEIAKKLVSISAGRQLTFKLNSQNALHSITYPTNKLQEFVVSFKEKEVTETKTVDLPFETHQQIASGEITSSLYEAALEVGMSNGIVMEMARIFGWDVDFVLDIRSGDHFHVIYESHSLNGKWLGDGNILAAEFTTQGKSYRAIRYEDDNGDVSFYTPEGDSMLGTFLRSPVEFSRISSRFGKRKHPILKTWRAHNGVDYAASRGTPIRTTADGKVVHVGKKGGYGRTVVINHAGRFSTLYAHMNGYAKGLKKGSRVKQGDVIGYVGSSGLATGPHLHYEFRVDGVHRNSLTYKTPKANSINAESKTSFKQLTTPLIAQLNSIDQNYKLAKSSTSQDSNKAKL